MPHDGFYFERLDVYQKALDVFLLIDAAVRPLPREWWFLRDQLRRAVTSIGANIAEGDLEHPLAERRRFFRIAKRSAGECAYFVDAMTRSGIGDVAALTEARSLLLEIVRMLTGLINRR